MPGKGLHLGGVAGIDLDLPGLGVENGVAAEIFLAHVFFLFHANLVKLCPHERMAAHRGEILAVHHLGHVVGRDGRPVVQTGGAVLVAARIAAVGVALGVTDEDRQVAVVDVAV